MIGAIPREVAEAHRMTFNWFAYRRIAAASQVVQRLAAQCLRLRFAVERHAPPGLFEAAREHCLILAPTHQTVLDAWLIAIALSYRQWRSLVPVRILATTTFGPPLKWLMPLVRIVYRLTGVIELPPKKEGGSLAEKFQGQLDALLEGESLDLEAGASWLRERVLELHERAARRTS